jgi:hypothetical protein
MDLLSSLVEAYQGNYKSYELLLETLRKNPSVFYSLIEILGNRAQLKTSREITGIFLKNIFKDQEFLKNWDQIANKSEIILKLLEIEDLYNISSLILSTILELESKTLDGSLLNLVINSKKKPGICCLGYYIENSRTIPQFLGIYLLELVPSILVTDCYQGLKLFQQSVKHLPPSPALQSIIELICQSFSSKDQLILTESYKSLVDVIFNLYDFIQPNFNQISEIINLGVISDDPYITLLSIECWNVLIDVEKMRQDENLGHHNYILRLAHNIITVLMKKIVHAKDQDEILSYCGTIEGVCENIHEKAFEILPFLGGKITNEDFSERLCGIYVLGSVVGGINNNSGMIVEEVIQAIQKLSMEKNNQVTEALVWLVYKLCEAQPQSVEKYYIIFEILYENLTSTAAKFAVDALLEIAESGVNLPDAKNLIEKLIMIASSQKIENSFNVIRAIFENLSVDDPTLLYYTSYFVSTLNITNKYISSVSSILRICFEKLSFENLKQLYEPVFFAISNLDFNEELLVSASCLSRYGLFDNYIQIFTKALDYCLSVPEFRKSGIICVGELVRNIERSDYLPSIVSKLCSFLELDTNPNIQIFDVFCDISSLHTAVILPYYSEILKYADHCMKLSLSNLEDEEFLQEIREALVLFFEGFIQGLGNVSELGLLVGSIERLVEYCLIVGDQKYQPSFKLIAGVLGIFSDLLLNFDIIPCQNEVKVFIQKHLNSDIEIIRNNADFAFSSLR